MDKLCEGRFGKTITQSCLALAIDDEKWKRSSLKGQDVLKKRALKQAISNPVSVDLSKCKSNKYGYLKNLERIDIPTAVGKELICPKHLYKKVAYGTGGNCMNAKGQHYPRKEATYKSMDDAKKACSDDSSCVGIYVSGKVDHYTMHDCTCNLIDAKAARFDDWKMAQRQGKQGIQAYDKKYNTSNGTYAHARFHDDPRKICKQGISGCGDGLGEFPRGPFKPDFLDDQAEAMCYTKIGEKVKTKAVNFLVLKDTPSP